MRPAIKRNIMSKYIDAEKLIAEIERRKDRYDPHWTNAGRELEELISFIKSLQQEDASKMEQPGVCEPEYGPYARQYPKSKVSQEQPEVELELEKEIDKFLNETGAPYVWCNDDEQKEWCSIIARHFWNKGYNARKKEEK